MAGRIGNWLSMWPVRVSPRLQLAESCCSLTGCLMVSRKRLAVFIPVPNGQVSVSELATWLAHSKSGQRENCLWRINSPPSCDAWTHVRVLAAGRGQKWGGKFNAGPYHVHRWKPFGSQGRHMQTHLSGSSHGAFPDRTLRPQIKAHERHFVSLQMLLSVSTNKINQDCFSRC